MGTSAKGILAFHKLPIVISLIITMYTNKID